MTKKNNYTALQQAELFSWALVGIFTLLMVCFAISTTFGVVSMMTLGMSALFLQAESAKRRAKAEKVLG